MDNVKALEMREISKSFGGVKALSLSESTCTYW